ncbi:MAG: cell wall-binding repeat-containing protein [Coriobacteriia bacterium]|nr:cell wall-binding repeat-containing protein [Coriobacteriia bacterium]
MKHRRMLRAVVSGLLLVPLLLSNIAIAGAAPEPVEPSVYKMAAMATASTGRPTEVEKPGFSRVAASGAVAQSVALSRGWSTASSVVLVGKSNWKENAVAPGLAGALDAPILATSGLRLDTAVSSRLSQMRTKTVYVIGGSRAVSSSVVKALQRKRIRVIRLAGTSPADTSRVVALRIKLITKATPVVIAVAEGDYAGAGAVSAYAAAAAAPVLLTNRTTVPSATKLALRSLQATMTVVVGPTSKISAAVALAFPGAVRVGGANAYDTSAKLADFGVQRGMSLEKTVVMTGESFPQAVLAGPWAGRTGSPILLTKRTSLPAEVKTFVASSGSSIKKLRVVGTTKEVATGVVSQMMTAAATIIYADLINPDTPSTSIDVQSVSATSLRVTGTPADLGDLKIGSVLIGERSTTAPEGYFRKVVGIAQSSGAVTLETTAATLSDCIAQGGLNLSFASGGSSTGAGSGSLVSPMSQRARGSDITAAGWDEIGQGASITSAIAFEVAEGVTINGSHKFGWSISLKWYEGDFWHPGPEIVEFRRTIDRSYKFSIKGKATLAEWKREKKLVDKQFTGPSIPIGIGAIPTLIDFEVISKASLSGEFSASIEGGATKTDTQGWRWKDGSLSTIDESHDWKPDNPKLVLEGQAEAKVSIQVEVTWLIAGLAGPGVAVEGYLANRFAVTVEVEASNEGAGATVGAATVTPSIKWGLYAGVTGKIIAKVDIFGVIELAKKEWPVFDAEVKILERTVTAEKLDDKAPVASSDAQPTYSAVPSVVKITATDDGSGVASVSYQLNGAAEKRITGDKANVSITKAGKHTLKFWATDKQGNKSSPITVVFFVSSPQSVRYFVKTWNVDDRSLVIVNGTTVVDVAAGSESGWREITQLLSPSAKDTRIEFKTYNAAGGYAWGYAIGEQRATDTTVKTRASRWNEGLAGVPGQGANNNDLSRQNQWIPVFNGTLGVALGL